MRFGICTQSANASVAARLGYDFIEIGHGDLLPEGPESEWAPARERLLESGLQAEALGKLFPPEIKLVGPQLDLSRVKHYVDVAFTRAAEVGVKVIAWGSPDARRVPDGYPYEAALEELAQLGWYMGEVASQHGLVVAVEPLASTRTNIIWTLHDGLEMVHRINHPAIQTMADIYQMRANGEPLERMAEAGNHLAHVHVSDPDRMPPGNTKHFGFYREAFTVLRSMGYDGRVCIEARITDFKPQATRGLAVLRACDIEATR